MDVLMPIEVAARLTAALRSAGQREIGGILMGECMAPNRFRIAELTIQQYGGSVVTFLRNVRSALKPLRRFFSRTGYDFRRYNYLGEWHSHPSFVPEPSASDMRSMWDIVEDPEVGATFAALVIVRLGAGETLDGTVTVFVRGRRILRGSLTIESTATA